MEVYTVVFVPVCKKVQPYTILHMGLGGPYRALERPRREERGRYYRYFTGAGTRYSGLARPVKSRNRLSEELAKYFSKNKNREEPPKKPSLHRYLSI
jgi:hypothetical protein